VNNDRVDRGSTVAAIGAKARLIDGYGTFRPGRLICGIAT
jgi:hypothetical protein